VKSLLERLQAEAAAPSADPHAFALGNLDSMLAGQPPGLLRALEAAVIPHDWDDALLARLLDPDLAPAAAEWAEKLRALPIVSRLPGSERCTVHEVTRAALRDRLHQQGRLAIYSMRALRALGPLPPQASVAEEIERLSHQLLAEPELGAEALETAWRAWDEKGRPDALNQLACALEEILPHLAVPARSRALLRRATIRAASRPATEILAQAVEAENLFARLGHRRRQAQALTLIGDTHVTLGDIASARAAYEQALSLRKAMLEIDPTIFQWQRDLSASLSRLGDLAVAQGDLAGALRYFTEDMTIAERLAASDPANAAWQRDLSISLNKLGGLAVAQGDLAGALRSFTESKTIAERLAASDPANAAWQRDLSVSLNKLGDLAVEQGDLAGASRSYTESKTIRERLTASDPANAVLQRDLSVSLEKLGDLAVAQGDLAAALHSFTESKTIAERLAASDPANAAWQRDLSVSLNKLGGLAVAQGDLAGALRSFTESKTIRERLAASDPANAAWQRDLSVSLEKLGNLAVAQGDLAGALRSFTDAKTIADRLAASDPANAEWQRDLWVSYVKMANHCEKSGQPSEAKAWWKKAHDTLAGMKQRGLHISPQDEGVLAWLRAKAQ